MFSRLRFRLLLGNLAAMVAVLVLLGAGVILLMDGALTRQEADSLKVQAAAAREEYHDHGHLDFETRHASYAAGTFYLVWQGPSRPAFNPDGVPSAGLAAAARRALAGKESMVTVRLGGGEALVESLPLGQSGPAAAIQVGRSLAPLHSAEREMLVLVLGAGGAGILMSVVAAWFLAERALVPIRLGFRRQTDFAADASHELRTPLAVLDAGLQVLARHPEQTIEANRDVVESLRAETARMARLVDDLLLLARADAGALTARTGGADAAQVLPAQAAEMRPLAASRHHSLEVRGGPPRTLVRADEAQLRRMTGPLIENAIVHTPPGTRVEVSWRWSGHHVVIDVTDGGPGIPAGERSQVLERFRRLDAARSASGAGLGLAIASEMARAHGGGLKLLDAAPGVTARLTLPAGAEEEEPDPRPDSAPRPSSEGPPAPVRRGPEAGA